MPNKEKDAPSAISAISNILVINHAKFRPYIELFHYSPENISVARLGEIIGFFQIDEINENSAYIVNFLTSIIKKEYYCNSARSISASIDSTLHKINLALAETAKHGNVNWVGKITAAVCVLEKNNLHFSVTGNAKIILFRNQSSVDISENFFDKENPNPLKTFSDVSSGKLETGDKIIISSEKLFDLFSLTELKKASLRFNSEKFIQFLRTALINEAEFSGTFVIDVFEKNIPTVETKKDKKILRGVQNVFSEQTFVQKAKLPILGKTESFQNKKSNYVDKKTGHIYVTQEQNESPEIYSRKKYYTAIFKENLTTFYHWINKQTRKFFLRIKSFLHKFKNFIFPFIVKKIKFLIGKIKATKSKNDLSNNLSGQTSGKSKIIDFKKTSPIMSEILKKQHARYLKMVYFLRNCSALKNIPIITNRFRSAILNFLPISIGSLSRSKIARIIPDLSKIKNIFLRMNYQQRIYSLLIVAIIIGVPFFYLKIKEMREVSIQQAQTKNIPVIQDNPSIQEKNSIQINNLTEITDILKGKEIFITKENIVAIKDGEIIIFENESVKRLAFPENIGSVMSTTYMSDINLIFIIDEKNKVFSFSPSAKTFTDNNIIIPAEVKIIEAGSYMTYLYLLDVKNSQIYRYPRAENGFGEKTNWLKDSSGIDFSAISSLAMDENIYLSNSKEILKFFRGKIDTDFLLDKTKIPNPIKSIYTNLNIEFIYIFSQEHGQVSIFKKDGEFFNTYEHETLKQAINFIPDKDGKKIYFLTENKLMSFELPL